MMNRRRRRLSGDSFSGLVASGMARIVSPTTDTGYKTYGTGRLFVGGGTNYLTNPSLETESGTAGLAVGVTSDKTVSGTPAYTLVAGRLGGYAQRVTYTSPDDSAKRISLVFPLTAAATFPTPGGVAASFWAKGTNTGITTTISASCYQADGTSWIADKTSAAMTLTAAWQRYTVRADTPALCSRVKVVVHNTAIDAGDVLDLTLDDGLLHPWTAVEPYFDGGQTFQGYPSCAWSGTVNASTSTRTVSALTIPVTLGSAAWTVAGRHSAFWGYPDSGAYTLLALYAGADARASVYKHTDNKLYASVTDGTDTVTSASAALAMLAGTVNTFVARSTWATTVDVSTNGTASTQGDASTVGAQAIDSLVISGAYSGAIGPLIISPTDKGATWQAAIEASSGRAFSDPMRLFRDFMSVGDYLFPLQGDSVAYLKVSP